MCSRPGDLSLVIPIFWMQESHKGGSTWESWILIGDWEIIGDRSGGQVQCIFIVNFRGHIRVGRVPPVFFFFWRGGGQGGGITTCSVLPPVLICFFLLLALMSPKLHYHWAAGDLFLCLWKYFVGTMNQGCLSDTLSTWNILHQQTLWILDVAEIESFISCLFSCVRGGHDATWLLIAIKTRFH